MKEVSEIDHQFSVAELEKKTADELRAMLVNDSLLPLDDDSNSTAILAILEVIRAKEHKTDKQREAERIAFWAGLLARYGDQIPIRLEDIVNSRKQTMFGRETVSICPTVKRRHHAVHIAIRHIAIATALVLVLFAGNVLVASAFNINVLRVVIDFTEEVFTRVIIPSENDPDLTDLPQLDASAETEVLQEALDKLGISQPKAPSWLPDGFAFDDLQIIDMRNNAILSAQFKSGTRTIVLSITRYEKFSDEPSRSYEKSTGEPLEYEYNDIVYYIFTNLDMTVATWFDGLCECDIQGNISVEEMKIIINSMQKETE
jgi:hypothetical protein